MHKPWKPHSRASEAQGRNVYINFLKLQFSCRGPCNSSDVVSPGPLSRRAFRCWRSRLCRRSFSSPKPRDASFPAASDLVSISQGTSRVESTRTTNLSCRASTVIDLGGCLSVTVWEIAKLPSAVAAADRACCCLAQGCRIPTARVSSQIASFINSIQLVVLVVNLSWVSYVSFSCRRGWCCVSQSWTHYRYRSYRRCYLHRQHRRCLVLPLPLSIAST